MSRVHDALRRAEMGGFLAPEEQPVPEAAPLNAEVAPADGAPEAPTNGTHAATPMRLYIHPNMLVDVSVVPFAPAPESHLLDLVIVKSTRSNGAQLFEAIVRAIY